MARLKSEFWIKAHLRTVEGAGAAAFVTRRGHEAAGSIYLVINHLDGRHDLIGPSMMVDGSMGWRYMGKGPMTGLDVRDWMDREAGIDPDFWVLEIEDRQGRHFLSETVEGE